MRLTRTTAKPIASLVNPQSLTVMFDRDVIDGILAELEEFLPLWAGRYSEDVFVRMLAQATDYIARGVGAENREYVLKRTGCLVAESGSASWKERYGRAGQMQNRDAR